VYPVSLELRGVRCLVVGGGPVGTRKVDGLLAEGADVTLVSPEGGPALEALVREGRLTWERRVYAAGEAATYGLVIAATSSRDVNRTVFEDARGARIWVNVADDPELCTFHLPARVARGDLQLTVSSNGNAPFVVRRLRQLLDGRFGAEWTEWIDAASSFREEVRGGNLTAGAQEEAFDRFFAETVDAARLQARVPSSAERSARRGAVAAGKAAPVAGDTAGAGERNGAALVSLVGAGPGDAGLLTLRGRERLMRADAVVYDRLAATALPTDLLPSVELHAVGKEAGNHPVPQNEINALLVRLAQTGKRVVRLKGGDPYVFGRGSEEAEALRAAGVPFEVVPGITSGVAVPAYAGIPVTHRKEAVRLTLLTAHESAKEGGEQVRWDLLAQDPHATIVGYMGVTALPEVARRLIEAGMDPETPGALIERGTTSGQKTVRAPLATLADEVVRQGARPPALFVIGPTAAHAAHLCWREGQPLFGQRIVIPPGGEAWREAFEDAGAEVVRLPFGMTPAARVVIGALPVTACLATSAADVDLFDAARGDAGFHEPLLVSMHPEAARRGREVGFPRIVDLPSGAGPVEAVAALRGAGRD
jgi:uroporphyrin-III C-methyltransferase/precorrin-2 dehydrogenase/sirohydrochlorin ferrochelatase